MKKNVLCILVALAMALLVPGCSSGAGESYEAPNMGSVADIAPSDATSYPADEETARALFTEGYTAMNEVMQSIINEAKENPARSARVSVSDNGPITFDDGVGGGRIQGSGSYSTAMDYSDEYMNFKKDPITPNMTYKFYISNSDNLSGTITNVSITRNSTVYTISGKYSQKNKTVINMRVRTDSTGIRESATANGTYEYAIADGFALSIKSDSGVGAKYLISFGASDSGAITSQDQGVGAPDDATATLTVYDDDNNVLYPAIDVSNFFFKR